MGLAVVSNREEEIVRIVVQFANLDEIDVKKVERLFEQAAMRKFFGEEAKWREDFRGHYLKHVQGRVQMFLGVTAAYPSLTAKEKMQLQDVFNTRMKKVKTATQLAFSAEDERLETRVVAYPESIEQVCWLAIGLCLDQSQDFYDRLWPCEGEGCGKVVLRSGRPGHPELYCESCRAEAKREANRVRQQEWRRKRTREYGHP